MILIWILAANLALAVLYIVIKRVRREGAGMAVYFIFLPGLGYLIYFLPGLLQAFWKAIGVDREAILIHAFEVEL